MTTTDKPAKLAPPTGVMARSITLKRDAINVDARTIDLAFSSEQPVQRWFGLEILSHDPGAVRMDRINNAGAFLMDHDTCQHVGVVESASIGTDRVGRAVARLGKGDAAEGLLQDMVDGIRPHISCGYIVHRWQITEGQEGEQDTYLAIDWEPVEISSVAIPADTSVGIGRGLSLEQSENLARAFGIAEAPANTETPKPAPAATVAPQPKQPNQEKRTMADESQSTQPTAEQQRAAFARDTASIMQLGEMFAKHGGQRIAREFLAAGTTDPVAFQRHLLDKIGSAAADVDPLTEIGMEKREIKRYSMVRAINALAQPGDRAAYEAAAFEREASEAVGKKLGRSAKGIFVPMDVQKRDLTVGTNNAGGYTVATQLDGANFIDLLRNKMQTRRLGARVLTGLVGQLAIPKQTGAGTAYWVAESGAPTESQQVLGQVPMNPKTVGAYTDISRKLLLQSSIGVESFVQMDLATVLGLAIDAAGINGSGAANQPTGVLNTAGIGSVALGTNGAAPTWPNMTALWSAVANANGDFGTTGFLTNTKAIGKLMATEKAASSAAQFIVPAFPDANGMTSLGGARCAVSNQVPSNLVKGTSGTVCSALVYGNWDSLVYGEWGALDLMVDPYTGSTSGTVRVVTLQDVDVAVRLAECFAAILDMLTT
jgi:HK97 family phage major capsid protein